MREKNPPETSERHLKLRGKSPGKVVLNSHKFPSQEIYDLYSFIFFEKNTLSHSPKIQWLIGLFDDLIPSIHLSFWWDGEMRRLFSTSRRCLIWYERLHGLPSWRLLALCGKSGRSLLGIRSVEKLGRFFFHRKISPNQVIQSALFIP